MCDPLSVAASVLAVAGFAVKSYECLYKTLRQFSEAPNDLQHHVNAIEALQSTFAGFVALENDPPNAALITPELKARLQACMLDLQAMDRFARSFHAQLEEGRACRAWAKIRWSSANQRQTLKRHLNRIELYHMSFSLDLLLLNIRLGLRPTSVNPAIQEMVCAPPDISTNQSPQVYHSENVSLRSSVLRYLKNDLLRVLLYLGPITRQQRHNSRSLYSNVLNHNHGYGIALALASNRYCPLRLELVVFLMRSWEGPSAKVSFHWNFFWPRTVTWDAKIVDLALYRDVDAMKREFSKGTSTAFDVLPDGLTLLHIAASQGHFDMVKLLLQEGARVNAMTDFGETPLHSAIALSENYGVSRVLVESGGDLRNKNADGKTPLHTFPSQVSEQILRCHGYLLDFSACDNRGMSLLHYFAWSSKTSIDTFRGCYERSSLNVRTVDAEGRSMLHLAAQRGNVPVVQYLSLTARDLNINDRDCRGRTVLQYGVESKRACITVTALVSHGASIWARDSHERSALHHAAKLGNLPAVKALLDLGMAGELRTADCFGMTPLQIALHHKAHTVQTFLAGFESNVESSEPLTGPSLVEGRGVTAAETDGSFGRSLSAPAQSRYDNSLVKLRQTHHWRMNILPSLQRQQYQFSDLNARHSLITCFVMMAAIWMLIVFLP